MPWNRRVVAVAVALGLASCKSAPKAAPRGPEAAQPDFVKAYVGQQRILLARGELASTGGSGGRRQAEGCDVAVEIRQASLERGTLSLVVESIGLPRVAGKARGAPCRQIPAERPLLLSGFAAGAGSDAVAARLDRSLPTPEAYLSSRGVSFDLAAAADPSEAASPDANASDVERRLGRQVTVWPKNLLAVDAITRDPTGKVRHEGEVEVKGIVGADGRLHRPSVATPLNPSQEERVLRVLTLWRFEPAHKGDERVPARWTGRLTFRID